MFDGVLNTPRWFTWLTLSRNEKHEQSVQAIQANIE